MSLLLALNRHSAAMKSRWKSPNNGEWICALRSNVSNVLAEFRFLRNIVNDAGAKLPTLTC
jgi:hypothetical protein